MGQGVQTGVIAAVARAKLSPKTRTLARKGGA